MSTIPSDLRYTQDHEWIRVKGTLATIGITDYAQQQLGSLVFVDFPTINRSFEMTEPMGTIESVKAVQEYYAPVTGRVVEINENLQESPELVNDDPYGEGWLMKIQITDASQLKQLLDANEYRKFLETE